MFIVSARLLQNNITIEKEPKMEEKESKEHKENFEIQIDQTHYRVELKQMTGLQLRALPSPPIGPDRDLFEVVPGGTDRKVGDQEVVDIRNGLHFFSQETHFEIQIDRTHYTVDLKQMTGLQLRALPLPPIGPDRDLFEVVPGGTDRKIGDQEVVDIRNGLRFFSAPAQINPGVEKSTRRS
jgi:hypothetical protein